MFDILHMFSFSIFNITLLFAALYFLPKILPPIIRASPPLSRVSQTISKLSVPWLYDLPLKPVGPPPSETYKTAFLLSQVIPGDVVPTVLDMAGFWIDVPLASTIHELKATEAEAGTAYLIAELPPTFPAKGLRSLTFTVTSRDQGWSWDAQWHGTYKRSWSWFEVVVIPPDSEESTNSGENKIRMPGRKIITNIHACKTYETHEVRWTYNDNDEEIRKLVRSIRGGTKIAITAWARFPTWVNDVRSARIDCQVNAVRKL